MRKTAYRIFSEQDSPLRRAKGLVLCRFVVIFFFMAAMLLPEHREVFNNRDAEIFSLLVGLTILNCLYFLQMKYLKRLKHFITVQMVVDLLAITAIIYLSGGESSSFLFLYFISIIAAGIMMSPRSSLLFASLSTISLSAIAIARFLSAYYGRGLPLLPASSGAAAPDVNDLVYLLLIHSLGFYTVAALTTILAGRLSRMRDLNRQIVEQFRDGLLVLDGNRIIFANRSAVILFGFAAKNELINKRIRTAFRRESDWELARHLAAAPQEKKEIHYRLGTGDFADIEVATYPLLHQQQKTSGVIAIVRDLTEEKKIEQAARVTEQLKEIQQMSAGLAHEIRNPLASIRGCSQQLTRTGLDSDAARKMAGIICRESDRLDGIISDFLQFARMRPPKMKKCDIAQILDEVADLIEARRPEKQFTLFRKYSGGLTCSTDRPQMVQLLLNLAVNALEAIGEGGTIRLAADRFPPTEAQPERRKTGREFIRVQVCDDGKGIAREDLKHIFTPFFSTKEKGVGLGLSIVNTIVEQHNMKIEAASEPDSETRFTLLIPIEAGRPEMNAAESEQIPLNSAEWPSVTV